VSHLEFNIAPPIRQTNSIICIRNAIIQNAKFLEAVIKAGWGLKLKFLFWRSVCAILLYMLDFRGS